MKVNISQSDEGPVLELGEIFCNTVLKTAEGNKLAICMRDDTIEMSVVGTNRWFRVDMKSGIIYAMKGSDHLKVEKPVPSGTPGMLPEKAPPVTDRRVVEGDYLDRKECINNTYRSTDPTFYDTYPKNGAGPVPNRDPKPMPPSGRIVSEAVSPSPDRRKFDGLYSDLHGIYEGLD